MTGVGEPKVRWAAVRELLAELGGAWRALAALSSLLPLSWMDGLYRGVAATRHRFRKPQSGACPIMPEVLRQRFE